MCCAADGEIGSSTESRSFMPTKATGSSASGTPSRGRIPGSSSPVRARIPPLRSTDPLRRCLLAGLSGSEIVFGLLCSGLACIFGLVWLIQGKPKGLNTVDARPGGRLVRSLDRGLLCSLDRDRRDGLRPPEARRHRQGRAKLSGHGPFRDGQLLLIFNTDGFVRPFLRSLAVKHGMRMLPVRRHGRAGRATKGGGLLGRSGCEVVDRLSARGGVGMPDLCGRDCSG
jgi:hypothetical protein